MLFWSIIAHMNNYKWSAFLSCLQLYLSGLVAQDNIGLREAARILAITIENTDNIANQVRQYSLPVSQMVPPYVAFHQGHGPAPEWWSHSSVIEEF